MDFVPPADDAENPAYADGMVVATGACCVMLVAAGDAEATGVVTGVEPRWTAADRVEDIIVVGGGVVQGT